MAANGGLIRREDLAAYRVLVEPALCGRYRDTDLAFSPGRHRRRHRARDAEHPRRVPVVARCGWQTVEGLHLRASAIAPRASAIASSTWAIPPS